MATKQGAAVAQKLTEVAKNCKKHLTWLQGHQIGHKSKGHLCDFLLVPSEDGIILHRDCATARQNEQILLSSTNEFSTNCVYKLFTNIHCRSHRKYLLCSPGTLTEGRQVISAYF